MSILRLTVAGGGRKSEGRSGEIVDVMEGLDDSREDLLVSFSLRNLPMNPLSVVVDRLGTCRLQWQDTFEYVTLLSQAFGVTCRCLARPAATAAAIVLWLAELEERGYALLQIPFWMEISATACCAAK